MLGIANQGPPQSKRALLEIFFIAYGFLHICLLLLRYFSVPMPASRFWAHLLIGGCILGIGFLLKHRRIPYTASVHALIFLILTTLVIVLVFGEGFTAPVLIVSLLVPTTAAYFLGGKNTYVYSALVVSLLSAAYWFHIQDFLMPSSLPEKLQARQLFIAFVCTLLVSAMLARGFERASVSAQNDLKSLNKGLQQANLASEQALKARSSFIATISHEIRTPLNGIIGMVDVLGDSRLDAKQREQLDLIDQSSHALLTLLNNVLETSRLEAGVVDLHLTPVNIRDLVKQTQRTFKDMAENKGVALILGTGGDAPSKIMGDATKISQVLNNLVSNAIKFTERGMIELQYEVSSVANDRVLTNISVTDSGSGISREAQQKIFQPFVLEDVSTTRRVGGTGLGLSICKGIIEQMGGDISVESKLGEGSCFRFSFESEVVHTGQTSPGISASTDKQWSEMPSTQKNSKVQRAEAVPGEAGKIGGSESANNILIVEDNEINRMVLAGMLSKLGYKADFAENGLEACEAFEARHYDLVLMDCQMPVMDGYESTRRIKQANAIVEPVVIAVTANTQDEDRNRCREAGMDDFLSKPIEIEKLRSAMAKFRSRLNSNHRFGKTQLV